ncbi:SLC13 family permease [Nonomuraea sp. M3C6]|uniref:SLC13 family permease n=1 Tax=Nonomuraea marmarensis TaxID=3351344 RepID=A0ABW7AG41_9ACTN
MSIHLIGVLALVLIFVIGTLRPVSIGVLALIATILLGTLVAGESFDEALAGFPPDLFVLLVGVTYLFGLAAVNGTIEWVIDRAVGLLGDRPATVPWVIFIFSAVPTTAGALGPAGVAMLAPLCLRLGERYGIDRRMAALMVMHGSCFGNFSPLNGLTIILRQAAEKNALEFSGTALFFGNAAFNIGLGIIIYLLFGGRALLSRTRGAAVQATVAPAGGPGAALAPDEKAPAQEPPVRTALRPDQAITLVVVLGVAVGALVFDIEIGALALGAAALLHVSFPTRFAGADKRIVWSVVLLICGVVTFVAALQRYGTVDAVGGAIAGIGVPLLTAYLICLVGAFTSAFASSAGLLGVLLPLAAPFLTHGQVGVTGMITALAVSATVVDSTPFSAVGALTLATAPEVERKSLFRVMLVWGLAMVITAPAVTWLVFVLPSTL